MSQSAVWGPQVQPSRFIIWNDENINRPTWFHCLRDFSHPPCETQVSNLSSGFQIIYCIVFIDVILWYSYTDLSHALFWPIKTESLHPKAYLTYKQTGSRGCFVLCRLIFQSSLQSAPHSERKSHLTPSHVQVISQVCRKNRFLCNVDQMQVFRQQRHAKLCSAVA